MNNLNDETQSKGAFEKVSNAITDFSSTSAMFAIALGLILIWAISGPIFGYSNTFLMVFLIQKAQNKESIAVQLKLNELIAANNKASNRLLNIQDLSEVELRTLYEHYQKLVELTQLAATNTQSHSVEEAIELKKAEEALEGTNIALDEVD